ncbi:MAG: hypothetical protein KH297_04710 [Firmicutes bacterium]|nr:hypothetical protein [Bacillota bacterium]
MRKRIKELLERIKGNKIRVIGMVCVLLFFILVGSLFRTLFAQPEKKTQTENDISQEEIESIKNDPLNKSDNNDDIAPQTESNSNIAEIDTDVRYLIPEEIQQQIPLQQFVEIFDDFLDENNLYVTGTVVESDGCITIDYTNNLKTFNVSINDYNNTLVTVTVNGDSISLSYR